MPAADLLRVIQHRRTARVAIGSLRMRWARNVGVVTAASTHLGRLDLRSFALATTTASGRNSTAPPPTVIYSTAYLN